MIKGHSHLKLQAYCSHVIFHVRPVWKSSDLWLILQAWLVVKAVQLEETWQAAALVNSRIRQACSGKLVADVGEFGCDWARQEG